MPRITCLVPTCYASKSSSSCKLFSLPRTDAVRSLWMKYLLPINPSLRSLTRKQLISFKMPLSVYRNIVYQHDGAPAHYARRVLEYLDGRHGAQWIGRGGPVQWPARSPDLTAMDFFLWGYVKNQVYAVECNSPA